MYNDIHGKENHLVKIQRLKDYVVPAKDCPPAPIKKKKGKKRKAGAGSAGKKKKANRGSYIRLGANRCFSTPP